MHKIIMGKQVILINKESGKISGLANVLYAAAIACIIYPANKKCPRETASNGSLSWQIYKPGIMI